MKKTRVIIKAVLVLGIFSMIYGCCDCPDEGISIPEEYYKEPSAIIPVMQAKEMYDTYTENKIPLLIGVSDKDENNNQQNNIDVTNSAYDPTRYVQYSIKDLKHYLAYIENESNKANVDVTGVRIYFGAYPDSDAFSTGGEIKYPNQETIFITPIAKFDTGEAAFFTRGDTKGGKRYAVPTEGLGDKLMQINGYNNRRFDKATMLPFQQTNDTTDDRSLTMNRGFVVPPPKKGDDYSGSTDDN